MKILKTLKDLYVEKFNRGDKPDWIADREESYTDIIRRFMTTTVEWAEDFQKRFIPSDRNYVVESTYTGIEPRYLKLTGDGWMQSVNHPVNATKMTEDTALVASMFLKYHDTRAIVRVRNIEEIDDVR